MKKILMLRFIRENNGLISLGTDWDNMVMESVLKKKNIVFTLFQKEILNAYELLEEMMTYQADVILFYRNKEIETFLCSFIELIKREFPEQNYVLWSKERIYELTQYLPDNMRLDESEIQLEYYSQGRCPIEQYHKLGIIVSIKIPFLNQHIVMSEENIIKELKFVKKNLPNLKYACLYSNTGTYKCSNLIAEFCQKEKLKIKMLCPEKEEHSSIALWNGLKASLSGMYPDTLESFASLKHIFVEQAEDINAMFTNLSRYVEINHTIFYKDNVDIQPELTIKTGYVISNEMKIEELEPNQYIFQLNKKKEKKFIIQNYSNYTEEKEMPSYVVIKEKEDFEAFKQDFAQFCKTGYVTNNRMWKPDMIDKCRFWNSYCCNIESIPRIRFNNGKMYPCFSSDYCAGTIEEESYQVSVRVKHEKAKTRRERNCDGCIRINKCSHCMALPPGITQEEFCDFMRDKMNFSYLNKGLLSLSYLYKGQLLPELALEDKTLIQVVTPNNSIFVKPKETKDSLMIGDNAFMFTVHGDNPKYILFSFSLRKTLSINEYFFRLCEFIARGYSVNEIASIMNKKEMEDIVRLEQDYSQVMDILRKYQMLQ